MNAIINCSELKNSDEEESITDAATYGRSNGNCESIYLCSSGCRYVNDHTCTATCR